MHQQHYCLTGLVSTVGHMTSFQPMTV